MEKLTMRSALALAALATAAAGCSFDVFNELEDRAPAARITQEGEISSRNFGDGLVGLPRPSESGAVLTITGNADAALATALVTSSGEVSVAYIERDDIKDQLSNPNKIHAVAGAPSTKAISSYQGPFIYLGSSSGALNTVRVVDTGTFKTIRTYNSPEQPKKVAEFGIAVAAADFGDGGTRDDLVVGAKNMLVLKRAHNSGTYAWPDMQDNNDVVVEGSSTDWPLGEFTVLAAGDLDQSATAEDEVVAAIPERNAVVIVHGLGACFADPSTVCTSASRLKAPSGASRFGSSLLIVDVDNDGKTELLVGAAGSNRVYVYDIAKDDITQDRLKDKSETSTIKGASDAKDFGYALAFGKFDGGAKDLLAVGAPGTADDGTKAAGRIFLYDRELKAVGKGTELASPEENMQIGLTLTSLPLKVSGSKTYDVLVAGGRDAVFIFFANLTTAHKDIRGR